MSVVPVPSVSPDALPPIPEPVVEAGVDGAAPTPEVETIRIVGWPDPVIDRLGYDPRSLYVETF